MKGAAKEVSGSVKGAAKDVSGKSKDAAGEGKNILTNLAVSTSSPSFEHIIFSSGYAYLDWLFPIRNVGEGYVGWFESDSVGTDVLQDDTKDAVEGAVDSVKKAAGP